MIGTREQRRCFLARRLWFLDGEVIAMNRLKENSD
jgi:hypothetical protein